MMSAYPPKAAATRTSRHLREVPEAVISPSLFDHLVGEREQLVRHSETERLGSFEIDREFVLCRRLHRQVRRFLAFEYAIDVPGGTAVLVEKIIPIGDQATASDVESSVVDGGQFVPSRKRDDQLAMEHRQRARRHDQAAIQVARECCDGALDFTGVANIDRADLHADRRRHGLDYGELADPRGAGGVAEARGPGAAL